MIRVLAARFTVWSQTGHWNRYAAGVTSSVQMRTVRSWIWSFTSPQTRTLRSDCRHRPTSQGVVRLLVA